MATVSRSGANWGGDHNIKTPLSVGSLSPWIAKDALTTRVYSFVSAALNDGDTWTTGLTNIVAAGWIPWGSVADICAPTFTSAGVVTFNCPGATPKGNLVLWTRG